MTAFQWIGLGVAATLACVSLRSHRRGRSSGFATLCWTTLWLAAGAAFVWPGITVTLARAAGIGRGADLVLYCWGIASAGCLFAVYARMRRLDAQITKLVRHAALEEARTHRPGASP